MFLKHVDAAKVSNSRIFKQITYQLTYKTLSELEDIIHKPKKKQEKIDWGHHEEDSCWKLENERHKQKFVRDKKNI